MGRTLVFSDVLNYTDVTYLHDSGPYVNLTPGVGGGGIVINPSGNSTGKVWSYAGGGVNAAGNGERYTGNSFTDDQYASALLIGLTGGSGAELGVICRSTGLDGTITQYWASVLDNASPPQLAYGKTVNDVVTVFHTAPIAFVNGDKIELEVQGTEVRLCKNNVALGTVWTTVDSSIATGRPGLCGFNDTAGGPWIDTLEMGDLSTPPPVPTLSSISPNSSYVTANYDQTRQETLVGADMGGSSPQVNVPGGWTASSLVVSGTIGATFTLIIPRTATAGVYNITFQTADGTSNAVTITLNSPTGGSTTVIAIEGGSVEYVAFGQTSKKDIIFLRNTDGTPATGKTNADFTGSAYLTLRRLDEATPRVYQSTNVLSIATLGTWVDPGAGKIRIKEISAVSMKGSYEIQYEDTVQAGSGADVPYKLQWCGLTGVLDDCKDYLLYQPETSQTIRDAMKLAPSGGGAAAGSVDTLLVTDTPGTTTLLTRIASAISVTLIWNALTSGLTTAGSVGKKLADWTLGTDNKALVSTDAQDVSTTFHVDAKTMGVSAVASIWNALTSGMSTVGSVGKRIVDFLTGDIFVRLGAPAGVSTAADIAAIKTDTGTIVSKTNNLPASPADQTTLNTVNTNVAAIEAKTNNLPASPADQVTLNTVNTNVAAIEAKTNNLPVQPAASGDPMTLTSGERSTVAGVVAAFFPLKKATAGQHVSFFMRDAANIFNGYAGAPTVTVSIDGGAFNSTTGTVTALGSGEVDFSPSIQDCNGVHLVFKATLLNAVTERKEFYTHT